MRIGKHRGRYYYRTIPLINDRPNQGCPNASTGVFPAIPQRNLISSVNTPQPIGNHPRLTISRRMAGQTTGCFVMPPAGVTSQRCVESVAPQQAPSSRLFHQPVQIPRPRAGVSDCRARNVEAPCSSLRTAVVQPEESIPFWKQLNRYPSGNHLSTSRTCQLHSGRLVETRRASAMQTVQLRD